MRVDVERIKELKKELNDINIEILEDIDFYENDRIVVIDKKLLDEWGYIGLNNTDFITTGYYKGEQSISITDD